MTFGWCADDGPALNAGLVALWFPRGSGPVLLGNPIYLCFSGRGRDSLSPLWVSTCWLKHKAQVWLPDSVYFLDLVIVDSPYFFLNHPLFKESDIFIVKEEKISKFKYNVHFSLHITLVLKLLPYTLFTRICLCTIYMSCLKLKHYKSKSMSAQIFLKKLG